jgi:hypothetical protein
MVKRENIDSGYPNFQLDTCSSGSRRNLDYLLTRRTLTDEIGLKAKGKLREIKSKNPPSEAVRREREEEWNS